MKYQALRPQFFSMGGLGWWGVGGWVGGRVVVRWGGWVLWWGWLKFDEKN